MDINVVAFSLIAEAGNAKSLAIQAIRHALDRDFDQAAAAVDECEQSLVSAHDVQTDMLRQEMSGQPVEVNLMMVHAQDHLNGALLLKDLSKLLLEMSHQIAALEGAREQ
ncbi:MAG TPA: PTS lactose/cellobiose transporter subunit IIA [Pseudoflavonifractor sp.]|jgi:PTS system cellobiose-specific IIA component|nr:PTS lactose/cellobiose transporter subunit IIA [Pseudoflavonifractor sp.]